MLHELKAAAACICMKRQEVGFKGLQYNATNLYRNMNAPKLQAHAANLFVLDKDQASTA